MVSSLNKEESDKWWEKNQKWVASTKESNELPEMRTNIKATKEVKSRAQSAKNRFLQGEKSVLNARSAIMFDSQETTEIYQLASLLGKLGHPLLVISRVPPSNLENEFGISKNDCKWLTESISAENSLGPALEPIVRLVEDFINSNERAVIILDGLEFLASVNGFVRALDFIREIVDYITEDDDLLIVPTDLQAWTKQECTNMLRELELVENKTMKHWINNPHEVEEHPFHLPDFIKEEINNKKINKILSKAANKSLSQADQNNPLSVDSNLNSDNTNRLYLGEIAQEWADEVILQEEEIEDTTEINQIPLENEIDVEWKPTFVTPTQNSEVIEQDPPKEESKDERKYATKGPRNPNIIKLKKKILPRPATEENSLPKKKQWDEAAEKSIDIPEEILMDKESKRIIRQTGLANMSKNNSIPDLEDEANTIEHLINKMSWNAAAEHAKKRGKNVR